MPERGVDSHGAFVGRRDELATLTRALPANRARGVVLWMVAGDAGIGKTRLLQELDRVARATGHRVVWGRGWDEAGTPPYWPWTQVVRQLQGSCTGVDLASFVLPDAEPADRFALFDATAGTLHQAATRTPLVVMLDDLQRSDPPSLLLTRFLLAHLTDTPMLVVATYRPDEAAARSDIADLTAALRAEAHEIELTGLELDAISELVGDSLGAADVRAVTGGNPLFVEQIVRLTGLGASDGSLQTDSPPGRAALMSAVTTRVARMDADVMELLASLAVLGPSSAAAGASALLGVAVDALEPVARRARDAGLLGPDGWSLSHPLVADAVLDLVPSERLAELHRVAADRDVTSGSSAAERAHHLCRAGQQHWEAAVAACCEAAEVASGSFAHADAVAHYERASRLLDDRPAATRQAFEVTFAMAAALERTGRRIDAEQAYERALGHARRVEDPELVARAAARHGIPFYADDVVHRSRGAECRAALALLPDDDSALRTRLLAIVAASDIGGPDSARLAEEAVSMGRRVGDAEALAIALVAQQVTDLGPSTLHRRLRTSREIIALADACGETDLAVRGRFLLKNALLEAGDVRELDAELITQDRLVTETADARFARHSLWFRCMRASFDGRSEEVEALAERCLAIAQELHDPDGFGVYTGQYGVALWMRGRLLELEPIYLDLMRAEPDVPLWPGVVGWIWLGEGRMEAARGMLDRLHARDESPEGMHTLLGLYTKADLVAALGDDELVGEMWEALLPYADRAVPIAMGAACFGVIARPLGQLALRMGRTDEGIAHLERAVEITARMGARPWLVDAQLALADALLDAGRTDDPRLPQLVDEASGTIASLDLAVFSTRLNALTERVESSRMLSSERHRSSPALDAPTDVRARVSVLGTFEVAAIDGSTPRWTSRKARTLLKILVARRGSPIAREQLMDLLWPGEDPDELGNRMSVAVSTVRRALDPDRSLPVDALLRAEGGTLRLMTDTVDVDVESFLGHCTVALEAYGSGDPDALRLLNAAIAEHRGEALPDEPYEPWADLLRSSVAATYARVLRAAAELAAAAGNHLTTSDMLRRLVELDPYDEPAHLGLVAALRSLGAHGQAEAAHRRYAARMADLGVDLESLAT